MVWGAVCDGGYYCFIFWAGGAVQELLISSPGLGGMRNFVGDVHERTLDIV